MLNRTYLKRSTFPIFTKKEALIGLLDSADCRDRTCDLRVTSALLYQLS